jgi:ankyrin repeat protein
MKNISVVFFMIICIFTLPAFSQEIKNEFITNYDKTCFFKAAEDGNLSKIKSLLEKMPKLVFEKDREGWTGLIFAARFNHKTVIETLVKSGAKLEESDHENFTALHHAAANGRMDAVKTLISLGAKVNAKTNGAVTPKKLADSNGHPAVASYIGKKGGF